MKTLHSFILKPGLFSGGIFALIIMLCVCGPAFAARVAGADENVNTTATTTDATKEIIQVSPEQKVAPDKQGVPSVKSGKEVKKEASVQKPEAVKNEKLPAEPAKKEPSKKYVTIDFDNVDIGVLVKFVSELTGKDFIIDEAQIYESRLAGADAVLLIARILGREYLESLIKTANDLEMDALVEVHSADEARTALDAGAELIGINNRDLDTLKVDLNTTINIMKEVPQLKDKIIVSESGISGRSQIEVLKLSGVNAVLVGEAILKSADMKKKIGELMGLS